MSVIILAYILHSGCRVAGFECVPEITHLKSSNTRAFDSSCPSFSNHGMGDSLYLLVFEPACVPEYETRGMDQIAVLWLWE